MLTTTTNNSMFPNLRAEMARQGIQIKQIADLLEKKESWVDNRLSGKASLPITEAMKIKKNFFPEIDFDVLFSNSAIIPVYEKAVK